MGPLNNGDRPLFMMPSLTRSRVSVPLSRGTFLSRLRQALGSSGLNPAAYSGHFMRKGGAQSLFDAGVAITITAHMRAHWARLAAAGNLPPPHRLLDFEALHD